MIGRAFLLSGLFLALGAGIVLRPTTTGKHVDEAWLERAYPSSVDRFSMVPAADGSTGHSYRMDDTTYQELKPFGIVGRTLTDGKRNFDVVVLAGDESDSFHNPLACFASQEWKVVDSKVVQVPTKSRGDVEMTFAKAEKDGQTFAALYTFEGPGAMHATNGALHSDMFVSQLKTGRARPATFFRFLTRVDGQSDAQVMRFAADYLDASPVRPIEKA